MKKTLKEIFDNAWKDMEAIYKTGAMCSERHMQCELFRLLKNDESFTTAYQVFVEPCLRNHGHKNLEGKIPDMVIATKRNPIIVAAIELKYTPHTWPKYQKDIDTLTEFWEIAIKPEKTVTFKLETDEATGQWAGAEFSVSEKPYLIYCIITQAASYIVTNRAQALQENTNSIWQEEGFENYWQYVGAIGAGAGENKWW